MRANGRDPKSGSRSVVFVTLDSKMNIAQAKSLEDISAARALFAQYAESLDVDLDYQRFQEELDGLPGAYAPPQGRLLLATTDSPVGCIALREHADNFCEIKRLYVDPSSRGLGVGRMLVCEIIKEAKLIGYSAILLDTLPSMRQAQALYASLGFVARRPYFDSPIPGNVFMELILDNHSAQQ